MKEEWLQRLNCSREFVSELHNLSDSRGGCGNGARAAFLALVVYSGAGRDVLSSSFAGESYLLEYIRAYILLCHQLTKHVGAVEKNVE